VFSELSPDDNLTVFRIWKFRLSYKNVPHKERVSLVLDALDRFHIVGKKDLFPSQLSGGQQQLVGVARAVILSPKLILATSRLEICIPRKVEEIMESFKRLMTRAQPSSRSRTQSETRHTEAASSN